MMLPLQRFGRRPRSILPVMRRRPSKLWVMSTRSSAVFFLPSPPLVTAKVACARRCCSTLNQNHVPKEGKSVSSLKDTFTEAQMQSSARRIADGLSSLKASTEQLLQHRAHVTSAYMSLLADRRAQYRDRVLLAAISATQDDMQALLRRLIALHPEEARRSDRAAQESPAPMTTDDVRRLKEMWTRIKGVADHSRGTAVSLRCPNDLRDLYSTLICSGLLRNEIEVRLVLSEMQNTDLIEPDASFYEALFISLWSLSEVRGDIATPGKHHDAMSPQAPDIVAGEVRQLRRSVVGDLAGYYMGHALAQRLNSCTTKESEAPRHTPVRHETWEVFFATLANSQPAPKLLELWWERFLEWLDGRTPLVSTTTGIDLADEKKISLKKSAVPYQAAHAVLSWCAQSREMEKALHYFSGINKRGVTVHSATMPNISLPPELEARLGCPGCLTAPSKHVAVQELQLSLLVKLMASTKSLQMVGGLRALVVRDVQQQIEPSVLYAAPWGVINDLIAGLSVPSAMELLRRCSSCAAVPPTPMATKGPQSDEQGDSQGTVDSAAKTKRTREIPFYVWASLLRRCCREHLQDEAESLFVFLRKKFPVSAQEKRELVEIMMRMYATMHPTDFPSTMDIFLQHILRTPEGEPKVEADAVLYGLLVKAADSRNAATMIFLEACAAGVTLTEDMFESLMGSTQYKTIASLSRKLPHDYTASSLDAQLKIPADVDAHLRREEALRARGKPLYDSTGDAG